MNSVSGKPAEPALIDRMCGQMIHRGPDDQGTHFDGELGLGMRRLSIIDLATGSQPIFNEDRSVCVVANGEIYNFRKLRDDLFRRGHQFATKSDTEVIVHLYEEYGVDFVKHLNGMFAIAVWDARRRRLVIVRDRMGQKPLYYAWQRQGLIFGSELKCLLESDQLPRRLDRKALFYYFTLGYIPNPCSIYQEVRQLPPAGRLVVEGDRVTLDHYWRLEFAVDATLSRQEAGQQLRELLEDSVRLRMISDVPLGAFLSGGLDSSILVALMAQQSSAPIKTFHIDFSEPDYSEQAYARSVAERYGTDHHELVVQPSAIEVLDDLVRSFDEPFGDSSAVPTYYVSQLTRKYVTVALAGDGGDESFGGYTRYQQILQRRRWPALVRAGMGGIGRAIHRCLPRTAPGRRYFRSLGLDHHRFFAVGTAELEARELLSPELLASLGDASTFSEIRPHMERVDGLDPLAPYASFDVHHYLPDDILTKVDRMSMAHSLELRSPMLDYRVVELAATMPHDWKLRNGVSKLILKETFGADLPDKVLGQRKRGFTLPIERWLRSELRPVLEEALHDRDIEQSGIFRMKEIRALADEHLSGRRPRQEQLWNFLFFTRWWHLKFKQPSGNGVSTLVN